MNGYGVLNYSEMVPVKKACTVLHMNEYTHSQSYVLDLSKYVTQF